jgi:cell division protease FtsH
MTDDNPQHSDEFETVPPLPPPTAAKASVRSGLAERQNPTLTWLKEAGAGVARFFYKDLLRTGLILASVAITITFFTMLGSTKPESPGQPTTLTQVNSLSKAEQIQTATLLDNDARVVVTTKAGQTYWTAYPESGAATQQLIDTLGKNGASVSVDQQGDKATKIIIVQFLLPILLLVCLFGLIMRLMADDGGAGGIAAFSNFTGKGKKKGKGTNHKVTFDDVAGAGDAVAELREIRDYLNDPTKYLELGAAAPKGVLLVGPPGTGKTLLAKAVAGESDAAFFSLSGSDFVESLVGVGAARVRDLFRKARAMSPAIIFIDEFDAAGRKRGAGIGQGNDEREQTLNQLLVEMDGFSGDGGLVVMGATNRPDVLDPALLRPGRFDRQVTVDVPDVHGRLEILNLHGAKRPLAPDASLEEIARLTPGFSGAELANVVNEAALLTVREGRAMIDQATLEEAIDRVVAGPAKKHIMSEHERWIVAIHEAAHVVAGEALGQVTQARKVSIVARGRSLGTAAHMLADRDQILLQEPDLERQLTVMLAGAGGERIAFGFVSTGVHDDLHAATALARSMVTSFGMSPELGPVTVGEKAGEVFLGASLQDLGSTGPETLNTIDRETERIVGEAAVLASVVLDSNWAAVEEIARVLLERETLSGVALDALLAPVAHINMHDLQAEAARRHPERFPQRDR